MHSAQTRTFATNCLFGAFFLAVFGWGMLQIWALGAGAGMPFHALIAVPGFSLCGVLLYRYSRHWPVGQAACKERGEERRPLREFRSAVWYVVLAASGLGVAVVVGSGSLFFPVLAAGGLVIVPWAKIPVCRDHFFISAAIVGTGAIIGLALVGKTVHPLHYPAGGCFFLLISSSFAIFAVAAHGNRFDRMPVSGY